MKNGTVTPGEWDACLDNYTGIWKVSSISGGLIASCGVDGGVFSEGNARLLSSSKDLYYVAKSYLECCDLVDSIIEGVRTKGNYSEGTLISYLDQVALDKSFAIDACRKARGEDKQAPIFNKGSKYSRGWEPWPGGICPLPEGVRVAVKYKNGEEENFGYSYSYRWDRTGSDTDIIAYRPFIYGDCDKWDGETWPPSVGSYLECGPYDRIEVVAIREGIVIGWDSESKFAGVLDFNHCRKILSDEDKAVEDMLSKDCDPKYGMLSREDFCRELYRDGYRKTGG